ncbi:hypothetical protein GCM10010495_48290 [Kitasatospora herbaricolor]|nr:hypothetical protein GCM10010495_48290 [Kitasatospora herbaricolor]
MAAAVAERISNCLRVIGAGEWVGVCIVFSVRWGVGAKGLRRSGGGAELRRGRSCRGQLGGTSRSWGRVATVPVRRALSAAQTTR